MRGWLLMAATVLAPLLAHAAPPQVDFNRCEQDADCVLVEGICGKAAVNAAYKGLATQYYAEQAKNEKACGDLFWRPEMKTVRCRLQSCQAMPGN